MTPRLTIPLLLITLTTFITGCSALNEHVGQTDVDHDVLTGGPLSGTTLADLPEAVRDTLKRDVPTAEIADIDKITRNDQVIFQFSFTEPAHNPPMELTEHGRVVPKPEDTAKGAAGDHSDSQSVSASRSD